MGKKLTFSRLCPTATLAKLLEIFEGALPATGEVVLQALKAAFLFGKDEGRDLLAVLSLRGLLVYQDDKWQKPVEGPEEAPVPEAMSGDERHNLELVQQVLEAVWMEELSPEAKVFFDRWYDTVDAALSEGSG